MSRAWLFGLILGIPLVGFATAEGTKNFYDSELRDALKIHAPDTDPAAIAEASFARLCLERSPEFREICGTIGNLNLMSAAAAWAAGVGILLLIGIRLAGSLARNNRRMLLWVFKPGLFFTAFLLILMIMVHAILAMGAMYYAESAFLGQVHVYVIAVIGLGALGGVVAITRNVFSLVRKAGALVIGKTASRTDAPDLWKRVDNIADRLGALRPESMVLGLDPSFFVTEADVTCLTGSCRGRTLFCSLPLMRILSTKEFDAIIGHELGHYKGLDTKFSQEFFPIYRGTADSIAALHEMGSEGAARIALLPAIALLSYFLEAFQSAETNIGRERELIADKEGAAATDSFTMATALVKVHAFSGLWDDIQGRAVNALEKRSAFRNVSKAYANAARERAKPEALNGLASTQLIHPTDTHPPLGLRLDALGLSINAIEADALKISPAVTPIALVPEAVKLEEEISDEYQTILAREAGIGLQTFIDS